MRFVIRSPIELLILLGLAVAAAGCDVKKEHAMHEFAVERQSWDTVAVEVEFVQRSMIGRPEPVVPDELTILVMDARYDTLYAGSESPFGVDDLTLGDAERLIVEVCGRFGESWICSQEELRASPKRVSIAETFRYPVDDTYDRGQFGFDVLVERVRFGGEGWEPVDFKGEVSGYIDAFVLEFPEARIQMPFTNLNARFDLRRHANYNDFRFYLDSQLMDHQEATVQFEVFGGIDGTPNLLASLERTVSPVTHEHRLANVHGFARQVRRRLVQHLSSWYDGRRMMESVGAWRFDYEAKTYVIEMGFSWRGGFFSNRDFRLEGELTVNEDGTGAVFVMMDGDRSGIDRWNERFEGEEVRFTRLELERPPERYRPHDRRLSTY